MRILHSFKFAFRGLYHLFKSEKNFQIHILIFSAVIILGFWLEIDRTDWALLLLVSAGVFAFEALNTAIEKLGDFVKKEYDFRMKTIKDISAAAVLIMALFSAAVGIIIFSKYLF